MILNNLLMTLHSKPSSDIRARVGGIINNGSGGDFICLHLSVALSFHFMTTVTSGALSSKGNEAAPLY